MGTTLRPASQPAIHSVSYEGQASTDEFVVGHGGRHNYVVLRRPLFTDWYRKTVDQSEGVEQ